MSLLAQTRMGMLLAVAGLLSLLVGVVLLMAGLKGVVLTGDWNPRNCTLQRVEERIRVRNDPLVMPRGGVVTLDAVVYFTWADAARESPATSDGDGYWVAAGSDVNFNELKALTIPQQRLALWEELSRSNDHQVQVFVAGGAKWPGSTVLDEWYETLPRCDGIRCGTSTAHAPPARDISVVVEPSMSMLNHHKLRLVPNETLSCYIRPTCKAPCSVLLSDPQIARAKAERAIITGVMIIILVICFSPALHGCVRRHTCTFHCTASSICSHIVKITDNPEEKTPLFRRQAA